MSKQPEITPAVMALAHPIRRVIIDYVSRGVTSPGEIAAACGETLGVVSYHTRMLRDYGILEVTRTEPRRGALQHFYGFTENAETDLAAALKMSAAALGSVRKWVKARDEALGSAARVAELGAALDAVSA